MDRRLSQESGTIPDFNYELGATANAPSDPVEGEESPSEFPKCSIDTPRMWTLSILFAVFGSSINLFFSLRYPSVSISPIIALLLAHPLGLLWDRLFSASATGTAYHPIIDETEHVIDESSPLNSPTPSQGFSNLQENQSSTQNTWLRVKLWLGQGRWNEKEHCCVFIASNVSFGFAFATDVIVEQTKFYNQDVSILYQLLLTISTQVLGYAIAGLTRAFLVKPKGMVWPGTLVAKAMFSGLHKAENKPAGSWTISTFRFFVYVCVGSMAFYFLPGLLIPALSYFNVITWLAPDSVLLANLVRKIVSRKVVCTNKHSLESLLALDCFPSL
jgi:OPT family oligopeptide transporter